MIIMIMMLNLWRRPNHFGDFSDNYSDCNDDFDDYVDCGETDIVVDAEGKILLENSF